jgi:hypothetical protein
LSEDGGRPAAVLAARSVGSLDYELPPTSRFRPLLIVPIAGVAVAGAALWWRRRRSPSV